VDRRIRYFEQDAHSEKTEGFSLIPRSEEGVISGNIFLAIRNKLLYKFVRSLVCWKSGLTARFFFKKLGFIKKGMTEEIADRIVTIVEPILLNDGLELVGVEYRREPHGLVLRFYIDKEGGVTVDDCTRVSREVGRMLDIEDLVQASYQLEVSSPGLTRPLKTEKDFKKYQNHLIRLKTIEPIEKRRQFKGRLLRMQEEGIEIETDGEVFRIPLASIAKANLELEF